MAFTQKILFLELTRTHCFPKLLKSLGNSYCLHSTTQTPLFGECKTRCWTTTPGLCRSSSLPGLRHEQLSPTASGGARKDNDHIWLGRRFIVQTSHSPLTISSPHSQESSSALQLLRKAKKLSPVCTSPTITAMPRASSVLAEWLKMQVALCTCFSCFWNWPNSPRSKKISREQVQTFLLGDHGFCSLTNLQGPQEISGLVLPFVWSFS